MSACLFPHFHKPFPYNENSTWIKPCYVDDVEIGNNSIYIDWIFDDLYQYYEVEGVSKEDFLRAFGQQATEYYLLKNTPDYVDYIGCVTYRRMLCFRPEIPVYENQINMPASEAVKLGTEEELKTLIHYMHFNEVITNRSTFLRGSVSQQYLESQPPEYWWLFHKAIQDLFPHYDKYSLHWFDESVIPFTTNYFFRKELFLRYASELFQILEYIYQNCSKVYPTKQPGDQFSEPLPWRYPGFIGERFLGFFINANKLNKLEVPLIFLQ